MAVLNAAPVGALTRENITPKQRLTLIVVLGSLVAFGPFTIDMYLPAFPQVQSSLGTTVSAVQLTLTATMVGFGLGQLVVGPLSDALGRRRPLLVATALHVVSSVVVALAPTVTWVMVGRVGQGIGAAGAAVVAMAMVRDLFAGQALIRTLARMALVSGVAPVIAPLMGSAILQVTSWRGVFVVLAVMGVAVTIAAGFALEETLGEERRGAPSVATMKARYKALFSDKSFIGAALIGSMVSATLFTYLSGTSFVLQATYGLSPAGFATAFAVNAFGLVLANQLAAYLMRTHSPRFPLAIGLAVSLAGAGFTAIAGATGAAVIWVLAGLFVTVVPLGMLMPSVQVIALHGHGAQAGTAASVLGAVNFALAGAISPLASAFGLSALSMGIVMAVCLSLGHVVFWRVVRPAVGAGALR